MHYLERWAQKPLFVISKRFESTVDSPIAGMEGLRVAFANVWSAKSRSADLPEWLSSNELFRDHMVQTVGETFAVEASAKNASAPVEGVQSIAGIFETSPQATADLLAPASPFTPVTIEIPFHLG